MRLTPPRHCTQPLKILLIATFVWMPFSCQAPVRLRDILTSKVLWLNERSFSPLESVLFGAAWFEAQCFQGIYSSSCHSRPCLISAMARPGQVVPGLLKFTRKIQKSYAAFASSYVDNLCLSCYWAFVICQLHCRSQSAESRPLVGIIGFMMTSCQYVLTEFASETQMMPGSLKGFIMQHWVPWVP